jgi:hypothetical protein
MSPLLMCISHFSQKCLHFSCVSPASARNVSSSHVYLPLLPEMSTSHVYLGRSGRYTGEVETFMAEAGEMHEKWRHLWQKRERHM